LLGAYSHRNFSIFAPKLEYFSPSAHLSLATNRARASGQWRVAICWTEELGRSDDYGLTSDNWPISGPKCSCSGGHLELQFPVPRRVPNVDAECRMPRAALRWTARATWIGFGFGLLILGFSVGTATCGSYSRGFSWYKLLHRQTIADSLSGGLTLEEALLVGSLRGKTSRRELNCNLSNFSRAAIADDKNKLFE